MGWGWGGGGGGIMPPPYYIFVDFKKLKKAGGLASCDFSGNLLLHLLAKFGVTCMSRTEVIAFSRKVGIIFGNFHQKARKGS